MFQLTNSKPNKLTHNQFAQILMLDVSSTFYEVLTDQVLHMFNEIVHQPILIRINLFKKSSLPCFWSFLFGIVLRCLTGRSFELEKAKLEEYTIISGQYYDLNVDNAMYL